MKGKTSQCIEATRIGLKEHCGELYESMINIQSKSEISEESGKLWTSLLKCATENVIGK